MVKKVGLGGAFGARYGTVARKRYVEIVTGMRERHECPRCRIRSVRRLSVGVWLCRKCGYKFAGGAYSPFTKLGDTARRVAGGLKPTVMETKIEAEAVEEKPSAKKRRKERAKAAEKPAAKRVRKEKPETKKKSESKPGKKAKKEAPKE